MAALVHELDRVADEVREHLHHALAIAQHWGNRSLQRGRDVHLTRLRDGFDPLQQLIDDRDDVLPRRLDHEAARFDRSRLKQIVEQPVHALGGAQDDVDLLATPAAIAGRRGAPQNARREPNRRQWAAQIM